MAKKVMPKIKAPEAAPVNVKPAVQDVSSLAAEVAALKADHAELAGDLVRIVDLLVKGDLDAQKFKDILAKRQGMA